MIVWYLDLQLLMQSVPITTKVESSIPLLCTHTPKSSNQNALFIGYDVLIGSFYDGKTLMKTLWSKCFNEDKDFLRIIPYDIDNSHDRALMKTRIS